MRGAGPCHRACSSVPGAELRDRTTVGEPRRWLTMACNHAALHPAAPRQTNDCWHTHCSLREQLRSVATLEDRQTAYELDGDGMLRPRSPCTRINAQG